MAHLGRNDKVVELIINSEEWDELECKRADVKPSRLLETIDAFANTSGGVIVIGIEDAKRATGKDRLYGVSENLDNVSDIQNLAKKNLTPPVDIVFETYDITNRHSQSDKILIITIPKSNDIHSVGSDTYVRSGSHNNKIGSLEIIRLKYEKGSLKYEKESSDVSSLDDVDKRMIDQFMRDIGSETDDVWQCLKDNGLAVKAGEELQLTRGGVLIFSKNPTIALASKSGIKISRYYGRNQIASGTPNLVSKPFTIEGPLLDQISEAVSYFRTVVKQSPPKLVGSTFRPSILIPEWAFQEAITNAVIHRNYAIEDDIHVRFFDDRIEIESPGTYPGHMTPDNIRVERYARNPLLLRALNRFQDSPNLDIGEGVDRMFAVMKESNLYEPIYTPAATRPNSVLVILLNQQRVGAWDIVSNYLEKEYVVSNGKAREITGVADTVRMSRMLKSWVNSGLLESISNGAKKSTLYKKVGVDLPSKLSHLFSQG